MTESLRQVNSIVVYLSHTDTNATIEKAWIELEGIEAIVKTASKAKFFIEFHSSCLEGTASQLKDVLHKGIMQLHNAKRFIHVFLCRDTTLD